MAGLRLLGVTSVSTLLHPPAGDADAAVEVGDVVHNVHRHTPAVRAGLTTSMYLQYFHILTKRNNCVSFWFVIP